MIKRISSNKPTVVHLLRTSKYSGAESVAIQIMRLMSDEFDSVYASPIGEIKNRVLNEGLEFHAISHISIREVGRLMREVSPDLIHAHDFAMSTLAALSNTEVPIVAHLHQNPPWFSLRFHPKSFIFGAVYPRLAKVIVVSNSICMQIAEQGLSTDKVKVVGNVVDSQRVVRMAKLESAFPNSDKPRLAYLGRLSEAKNPLAFVRIVDEVLNRGFDVDAVMIGDGELLVEVERSIADRALNHRITLAGYLENPYSVLADSFALVMPSKWEGFGLAAIEASSLGIPVIARAVGGLRQCAVDGAVCESDRDMADAICNILTSKDIYRRVVEEQSKVLAPYTDVGEYARTINGVYKEIIRK